MSEIKARYSGPATDGVTLGVVLDDGDIVPFHVKHGGELPQEIDGRKVSTEYRDGLLAQEDNWTKVRRQTASTTQTTSTPAKPAGKDGEK
jgi:hypothetical protein